MISKEKFIEYMDELQKLNDAEIELNNAFKKISSDNTIWFDKHETLILDILQNIFDDQENDWIGYAIYELDWFKKYKDGMIVDQDGNDILLKDAEDLYNLLICNINSGKKCDTCEHSGWMTMDDVAECNICENHSNYSSVR